jgi:hypothetical protein
LCKNRGGGKQYFLGGRNQKHLVAVSILNLTLGEQQNQIKKKGADAQKSKRIKRKKIENGQSRSTNNLEPL